MAWKLFALPTLPSKFGRRCGQRAFNLAVWALATFLGLRRDFRRRATYRRRDQRGFLSSPEHRHRNGICGDGMGASGQKSSSARAKSTHRRRSCPYALFAVAITLREGKSIKSYGSLRLSLLQGIPNLFLAQGPGLGA
ncbi:MAG: hypothetical protein SLRJCFUN_002070 [Candidatus Fervidibacter sp.]